MLYHVNILVDAPDARAGEAVYRKCLEQVIAAKLHARGTSHAAGSKGCGCNVLDLQTVIDAKIEERNMLAPDIDKPGDTC